ncbi:hypothetical protein T484DRAFT_1753943 [Baffinella frigidus]|nr:hypothetical protein T484DRAFT_1753943 [Cryptophyta sp. CCMP2293]
MDNGSCPVCMTHVPLSFLDGCGHMFCMSCAVKTSATQAVCPLCREAFTTVSQTGGGHLTDELADELTDELTYHVRGGEGRLRGRFKIRGFIWVSAFCMGLANRLVFKTDAGECLIMLPQYLRGMLGCHDLYYLSEAYGEDLLHQVSRKELEEGGDISLFPVDPHEEAFVKMEADLVAWKGLPLIYTRLIIALHIEAMIKKKMFVRLRLQTDAVSVAERLEDCSTELELESDASDKILLCSYPLEA